MPIIPRFITGHYFLQYMFNKFLYFILFCTCKVSSITRNTIIYIHGTIFDTITFIPNILTNWINKPRLRKIKKRYKISHGSRKFSQNLRTSRNSWYNEHNCKSGRHDRRHTFIQHKSQTKGTPTDNSKPELKNKSRKKGVIKYPLPRRRDQMLCAINYRTNCQDRNKIDHYILSYKVPDLCNDYISKEHGSKNRFYSSFSRHCVLGHVFSNIYPLDDVDSWKEVVRPTKKPRSVGPHKSKPIQTIKKTTNNKRICQKNRKSRIVTIQIPEDHRIKNKESRSDSAQRPKKPRRVMAQKNPMNKISELE